MRYLRQSTSVDLPIGPFVDATDGVTAETGLTLTQPDIRLKKNGGAWAQKAAAQTLTHEENGFYEVTLDATDTNTLGAMRLAVFESGAAPVWEDFVVLQPQEFDRLFTSTGHLHLGIASYGTAQSATGTGVVLAASESLADDVPNGQTLVVQGSTQGYPQARQITDYVNSTDTATVDTFTVTPSGTVDYVRFLTPPAVVSGTLPAVNATQIGGQTASASGTITFPNATLASTTNITAGTITTVTNLTNAPTNGDFTATMKTSIGTAVAASAVASVTAGVTLANNAMTAAAAASDFGTEIANAVLTAAASAPIAANVEQINTVAVTGNGVSPKFGV